MRSSFAMFLLLCGSTAAQSPPAAATLETLGLKTVWTSAIPLTGERDGVATVQVADDKQIFVQTRGGYLVAFDATTGERQWAFRYDTVDSTPFAVAWNERHVFALNVTKLYGVQRLSGVLDFAQSLPLAPLAAPIADNETVYAVMTGNRLGAFILPPRLEMPNPGLASTGRGNPADVVARRYPSTSRNFIQPDEEFDRRRISLIAEPAGSFGTTQRTASLAVVATLRPPFSAFDEGHGYLNKTPSLNAVSSLRQPYHLADPTQKNVQRSPSIAAIPPSLVSLYASTDLRPRGVELKMKWIFGSSVPMAYAPLRNRNRVWVFTQTRIFAGLDSLDGKDLVNGSLTAEPTTQPSQAEDVGFIPQQDGYLTAMDLTGGSFNTATVLWKANVGGLMDHPPLPTRNGIYQAGTNSGIVRVDRATGDVVWRADRPADRILAINDEYVYARDNLGRIYVFDRNRVSDRESRKAYPLATADLGGFNVAVTNTQTDRIYLASDRGMFVCLRDAAPKYAVAKTIAPPAVLPAPAKPAAVPTKP